MRIAKLHRFSENSILFLLAFTILWKGGKTLESTWLLVGVASFTTLVQCMRKRKHKGSSGEVRNAQALEMITLLFLGWTVLSSIYSETLNYGLDEVLRDCALGLLFLWYIHREETEGRGGRTFEERFLQLLSHLTLASCIVGLFIYVLQPVNRFVGTFLDPRFHTDYWPNAFAEFLLLAWPIVLLQAGNIRPPFQNVRLLRVPLQKIFPLLPTGFVLGCLFLTFSRGGIIAFIGQIVLLTILLLRRQGTEHKVRIHLSRVAASLFIGFLTFSLVNALRAPFHPIESVQQKITFTAAEGSSSASERASFWAQAIELSREKPIFGWGPGSFRFVQPHLQETVLATSDHPHNIFLKLSAERGIPAMLLFLFLLAVIFREGLQTVFRGKRLHTHTDDVRFGSPLLFIALAGVIAHTLIDFNLQFVGIALPFWLLMGMLLPRENKKRQYSTRGLRAILATMLLLVAFREGIYLTTSSLGRHAEVRGDGATALVWYEKSQNEWFTRDMNLSRANLLLGERNFEEAEKALLKYLEKNAHDARAWNLLGNLLVNIESFDEAIEAYKTAFAYGGWNDLSISNGFLQALLAETYTQPTTDAAADSTRLPLHPDLVTFLPAFETRVLAFARAIEQNLHFVALSPNPEEAVNILITLSVLSPEKTREYRATIESIERETLKERERWKARKPGWLW